MSNFQKCVSSSFLSVGLIWLLGLQSVQAQSMGKIFPEGKNELCVADTVDPTKHYIKPYGVLNQIIKLYPVNVYEIRGIPEIGILDLTNSRIDTNKRNGVASTLTYRDPSQYWMIEWPNGEPDNSAATQKMYAGLDLAREELSQFAVQLFESEGEYYAVEVRRKRSPAGAPLIAPSLSDDHFRKSFFDNSNPLSDSDKERLGNVSVRIARALFSLDVVELKVKCKKPPEPPKAPEVTSQKDPVGDLSRKKRSFRIRGKVDGLIVPNSGKKPSEDKASDFAKLDSATLSFSNDAEDAFKETGVKMVVGMGWAIKNESHLFGYVSYEYDDKESGEDPKKDKTKHHITPGFLYNTMVSENSPIRGDFGLRISDTFDLEDDSELLKARLSLSNIEFNNSPCGENHDFLGGKIQCNVSAHAEIGHIVNAGTSEDLLENDDDEYIGLGGSFSLNFSAPDVGILKPFSWKTTFERMDIVQGELTNPDRFETKIVYNFPNSWMTLELSYEEGQDLETFKDEEKTKLSLGFKY